MGYIVRHGETLHKIAKRHNTKVHHLLRLNPHLARKPHLIYPGEHVRVR